MKTKLLLLMLLFCCTLPLFAQMRITEFMYKSMYQSTNGQGEFIELTNVGNAPINLSGWSYDDDLTKPGSFNISGFGYVQPGESVIITDTTETGFRTNWSLPSSVKVLGRNVNNNLSRNGNMYLLNGSNPPVDQLTYGDQGILGSIRAQFRSGYTILGNLGMNMIANWVLSSVGDALVSKTSTTGDIGNPGHYIRPVVCINPPTIQVANTTTNFISLPTNGSGHVSGVLGDPTDPARTSGVNFLIADPGTPVSSLTVTVSSNNANVTPNLTGTGAIRNLKIIPAAVGYATVTVSVTDGTCPATYVINYAASAASATQSTTRSRSHTGASDASTAVPVDGAYMIVADDENQVLRLYDRANSGLPVAGFDFTSSLQLTDANNSNILREVDIEASIRQNNRIFWFGSQSNSDGGGVRPNRNRVFATDVTGSGASTSLTYVGRYDALKTDIVNWDATNGHGKGPNYYGLQASTATDVSSKTVAGYNIEGAEFAPDGTTAYIAFRAPQVLPANRQKALIIAVTNLASLITSLPGSVSATFGLPIELDLGGRGIREIRRNAANQYVIIAGPAGEATGTAPFRLYTWTGNASDKPVERTTDLTALNVDGSFESIVEVPSSLNDASQLQVLVDNGDAVYYNDGNSASKLGQNNFKKFRSDLVTLGAPVNTAPTVANAITNQTGRVNQPFSYTVTASTFTDAETPNSLTMKVSGLPISLSFASGIISGTPSVSGVSTVTVTATDPGSLSVSTQFTLTVNPPFNTAPTVANAITNQTGRVNQPFSYTVTASTFTDAQTPNALVLTVAGLPTGLSFASGIISGTPSVPGVSTVIVTATDPGSLSVSTQFTITVNPLAPLPTVGAPTYDCKSGELTFNTTVGDGTLVEYQIMGVVPAPDWTANSTFSLPRDMRTNSTLTLMARQSGKVFTFEFSLRAACPPIEVLKPTYDCKSGLLTFNTRGGMGSPIEYKIAGVVNYNLNRTMVVPLWIRTATNSLPLKLTARQSGQEATYEFNVQEACPAIAGKLDLVAPTYSCSTGGLTINIRGGNNTAIEYMIPGVRNTWSANPNFIIPASTRRSTSLTLSVRQSGVITSAGFDLSDFCRATPMLEVITPTYSCSTGALTIKVGQGNGSGIEYSIPGIRGWATSPNFTIPLWIRTDETSDPLILLARQSGIISSYVFDINSVCPVVELISLLAPTYDCKTGELTFNVSNRNGSSLVEYLISGVTTSWSKASKLIVPVRYRKNLDLLLMARQGGVVTSYIFELQEFCGDSVITSLKLLEPSYACKPGALSIYTSGGNGNLIEYMIPGVRGWSKNPNFIVPAAIRNNPDSQPLILLARQSGDIVSSTFNFRGYCEQQSPFEMVAPNYVCQTGRLTLYTMPGTGNTIEYMIPGVRGYSTNPNFVVPAAIRNNPNSQPLTLVARQNGVVVSILFDFREFCRTGILTVLAPTYACATGKLTINTSGGNGSLLEYMIPGIRGWSMNHAFIVPAAIRNNPSSSSLNLLVRQGDVLVNSVFNVRSFCAGTARQGVEEVFEKELQILVLGNPVKSEAVVEIGGAVGEPLTIRLVDETGRLVDVKSIPQANEIERVVFDVSQQPTGILILHVMTSRQTKAVRLLKQ